MEKFAVYGTGKIASGQATLISGNGIPVTVIGRSSQSLQRCRAAMEQNWADLIAEGLAVAENQNAAMRLVTFAEDAEALTGCTFVFEAVSEDVEVKRSVYAKIERYAADSTVIASTTSSIPPEDLANLCFRPAQLLVTHPFQPVHMLPLVELVVHQRSAPEVRERAYAVLARLKREVVVLEKGIPGFLINRFAQALFREAIYLMEQGVATAEDIDKAVHLAVGMRYASIGLLEYFDAVGFNLESAIAENVYPDLCAERRTQRLVREGIQAGKTGQAVGEGLFDWRQKDADDFHRRMQRPYYDWVRKWTLPTG